MALTVSVTVTVSMSVTVTVSMSMFISVSMTMTMSMSMALSMISMVISMVLWMQFLVSIEEHDWFVMVIVVMVIIVMVLAMVALSVIRIIVEHIDFFMCSVAKGSMVMASIVRIVLFSVIDRRRVIMLLVVMVRNIFKFRYETIGDRCHTNTTAEHRRTCTVIDCDRAAQDGVSAF